MPVRDGMLSRELRCPEAPRIGIKPCNSSTCSGESVTEKLPCRDLLAAHMHMACGLQGVNVLLLCDAVKVLLSRALAISAL